MDKEKLLLIKKHADNIRVAANNTTVSGSDNLIQLIGIIQSASAISQLISSEEVANAS